MLSQLALGVVNHDAICLEVLFVCACKVSQQVWKVNELQHFYMCVHVYVVCVCIKGLCVEYPIVQANLGQNWKSPLTHSDTGLHLSMHCVCECVCMCK